MVTKERKTVTLQETEVWRYMKALEPLKPEMDSEAAAHKEKFRALFLADHETIGELAP